MCIRDRRVPELRAWAHEVSAGMDSGVRVSLRLEVGDGADPAADTVEAAGENAFFRALVQVHSLADPTRVADAGDLWGGAGLQFDQHQFDQQQFDQYQFDQHGLEGQGFGARARLDTVLAARLWAPLGRLLHAAVPDELVLADEEVEELLGQAATCLLYTSDAADE